MSDDQNTDEQEQDEAKAKEERRQTRLGVCRIGRTEEAKECWSGLGSDYRLHESMLSQIVG